MSPRTWRCSVCEINYPTTHAKCAGCGGGCTYGENGPADDDWEERSEAIHRLRNPDSDLPDEAARAFRVFLDIGFDPMEALELASEGVSPSRLREMIRHGCDAHTAASILL